MWPAMDRCALFWGDATTTDESLERTLPAEDIRGTIGSGRSGVAGGDDARTSTTGAGDGAGDRGSGFGLSMTVELTLGLRLL